MLFKIWRICETCRESWPQPESTLVTLAGLAEDMGAYNLSSLVDSWCYLLTIPHHQHCWFNLSPRCMFEALTLVPSTASAIYCLLGAGKNDRTPFASFKYRSCLQKSCISFRCSMFYNHAYRPRLLLPLLHLPRLHFTRVCTGMCLLYPPNHPNVAHVGNVMPWWF